MKLKKLRTAMAEKGIASVLVLDPLNQQYLCDFAFTDGFLLITHNSAHLVTDFRYYEMAINGANKAFEVCMPEDRKVFINQILHGEGITDVGFEGSYVSYDTYKSYCDRYPSVNFVNVGDMIEMLREVKSSEELAIMQKAQDITDKAFSHILRVLNTGMTELDVAVELEYAMRKNGADSFAFETIAVSGDASALPHGTPRNVRLRQGFLTMDFGAKLCGYCSDMTRTVVIGKADAEIKKLYNTVLEAQLRSIDYLKAGCDCGEADKVARDIINKDYNGAFGHSLGHSVGLFIHESPRLSFKSFGHKTVVGNVLTVEPGIYLFGKYGCRIEDMVAIEENGVYNFTKSTKELIEIY